MEQWSNFVRGVYRPALTERRGLRLLRKNSSTAWRTNAEIGASDFFESADSARSCLSVSHTTVRFMCL